MKLPLRSTRPSSLLLGLPLALSSALLVSACSSEASDAVGSSSAAVVSATTTYLLPVDDGVREACRATWTGQFCAAGDAVAAGEACVSAYVASGATPACAKTAAGCFNLLTTSTPCTGDRPIYQSAADCQAPVERTCAFYSACLEQAHSCGEPGYAIGYGEKYCSRYDVDQTFSPEGLVWRDAVLHCLQEALVPELAIASKTTCDALTTFAFDSHPGCYTASPSICFLPPSDVLNVVSVIDGKDLLSLRSAKQMASVAATCVEQIGWSIFSLKQRREADAIVPPSARSLETLNERLAFWQDLQARAAADQTAR